MVGPMSIRQLGKQDVFYSSAPGTDGIGSTRLRGQRPCAVPEGHGTHQPPQTTEAVSLLFPLRQSHRILCELLNRAPITRADLV
jgi:hypothetical protein